MASISAPGRLLHFAVCLHPGLLWLLERRPQARRKDGSLLLALIRRLFHL